MQACHKQHLTSPPRRALSHVRSKCANCVTCCRRIRFLLDLPRADYLLLLSASAAVLDPFPASAAGATVDAFSVGALVLTAPNMQTAGMRYAAGIYSQIGMSNCTANSVKSYIRMARRLASSPALRRDLRAELRRRWHDQLMRTHRSKSMADFVRFFDQLVGYGTKQPQA